MGFGLWFGLDFLFVLFGVSLVFGRLLFGFGGFVGGFVFLFNEQPHFFILAFIYLNISVFQLRYISLFLCFSYVAEDDSYRFSLSLGSLLSLCLILL